MQALHDVIQAGHARYLGMSSCWAWQFQLMQRESTEECMEVSADIDTEYAIQNRLTPFISMQNFHNAVYREVGAYQHYVTPPLTVI
jgi:aryl-alcohol dehydrogenase-like predicted oxidoreductase